MDFENTFMVKAPIAEVYDALMDVERVVVCMPGAEVLAPTAEDTFSIGVKVKLGPMTMTYRGDLQVLERDQEAHAAAMRIKVREVRGQGTAAAEVGMRLHQEAETTHATINAKVQLSGRAATMGSGIIEEVSGKLVEQFAENLAAMLAGGRPEPALSTPADDGAVNVGARSVQDREPTTSTGRRPAEPTQAPVSQVDSLRVAPLAASMLADRMRDPRVAGAMLGAAVLFGYVLGARSRR